MNKVIYDNCTDFCERNREALNQQVSLVYLDPPYNSYRKRGARKNYNDSNKNWTDTIRPVIKYSYEYLREEGFIAVSINQSELFNLKMILDEVFLPESFIGLFPVKIRHQERQLMINATFHDVYEYLLIYRKNKGSRFHTINKEPNVNKFIYQIEILDENCERKIINGKEVEIYNANQFKVKKVQPDRNNLRQYTIAGKLKTANWSGEWFENHLRKEGKDKLFKVYGLENEGLGYRWFQGYSDTRKSGLYYQSIMTAGRPILPTNDLDYTEEVTLTYKEGGEGCDYKDSKKPEKLLKWLLQICTREEELVLDLYGGSGTTIATCVKNNRVCYSVDNSEEAIRITRKRLDNIRNGQDIDNIRIQFDYEYEDILS